MVLKKKEILINKYYKNTESDIEMKVCTNQQNHIQASTQNKSNVVTNDQKVANVIIHR